MEKDEAFEMLRKADPAGGLEADRVTVIGLIGDKLQKHQRRNVVMAAGLAAVLALGVGAGGTWALTRPQNQQLSADAPGGIGAGGSGADGVGAGSVGAPISGERASDSDIMPYWNGRQFFRGTVSGQAGESDLWVYEPGSGYSKENAERFAAALGVDGEATQMWGSWYVGQSESYDKPNLSLNSYGTVTVNYSNPQVQAWGCEVVPPEPLDSPMPVEPNGGIGDSSGGASGGATAEGGTDAVPPETMPEPCQSVEPSGTLTTQEAEAESLAILKSAGVDTEVLRMSASADGGWSRVDGYRTSPDVSEPIWHFEWYGDQLVSMYGTISNLVDLGTYPVVSAQEALARLNDPRYGPINSNRVYPAMEGGTASEGQAGTATADATVVAPTPTTPDMPKPGEGLPWAWSEIELKKAVLSNSNYYDEKGRNWVVPVWTFSDKDGNTWSALALAESALN